MVDLAPDPLPATTAPTAESTASGPARPRAATLPSVPYVGWGLRRSWTLFTEHRKKPVDPPPSFYRLVAADSVRQLSRYVSVAGQSVLDVGGGPGYFRDAFLEAGSRYCWIEPDVSELAVTDVPGRIRGSALALPVRTDSVDICYTSNVLEHVPDAWQMCSELVRVTRPGGLIYLSYCSWLSPWGGHETAPWHYLGGRRAQARYERLNGEPPKNIYGETMFPVYVGDTLAWARSRQDVVVIDALPRYLPDWSKPILKVPGVREVLTWNLLLILRKI
ncbi:class I SAM-dependent methyltransferase [Pseudofrankia sp. BMG5.37]|uniref:class I SAM-dependent methyltransferase n=1 Tax=Pseudofrankia sp. BMG5.37 TaxID=3050035 RepID=UPI000AF05D6E